jgi:hypothetical protein
MKSTVQYMARSPVAEEIDSFMPVFLTRAQRINLKKLLPPYYHSRMSLYFRRYGCLGCHSKRLPHECNGFCSSCHSLIQSRFRKLDRVYGDTYRKRESWAAKRLLQRLTKAKELLADLKSVL